MLAGLAAALLILGVRLSSVNAADAGIYGGGPFYKNTDAITEIKNSGFTEAIVWNIAVNTSGDLNFNYEFLLCQNGAYVGNSTHADFPANMAALKQGTVNRVTFCIGSSNTGVFQAIQSLVNSQGTGSTSILYKNFQALKAAVPSVDAIDFDDENCYDQTSMVQFAVMLGNLGYKVSLCPYTNSSFWTAVASQVNSQRPGTIDRVHLQCYAGGGGNSPNSVWNFGTVPVEPGLWDNDLTPSGVQSQMATWKSQYGIIGGWMWLYDDFVGSGKAAQYATAINKALTTTPVITSATTATATAGTPFSYQITAANSPTSYSVAGQPAWLSVNASSGLLTGTPPQAGTVKIAISATNAAGTNSVALTITVQATTPVITSATTATATAGSAFSYQITAANSPTSYSVAGQPAWLSVNASSGLISGTPTQAGDVKIAISATNAAGTGSAVLKISVQSAFMAWQNTYFTAAELNDPTISGPNATPAGDGISNLAKYALGLKPKTDGTSALPTISFTASGGSRFLTLTYNKSLAASDVTCVVEVSGDLQTWSSGANDTTTVSAINNAAGTMQTVVQRDLTPTGSAAQRFIRLRINQP